jgi:alkaline phosphatase D
MRTQTNWKLLGLVAAFFVLGLSPCIAQDSAQVITKIAFGSCAKQTAPCPIWETIADYQPDLLLLLGDNVYADNEGGVMKPATPEMIEQAYREFAANRGFERVRESVPIMGVWDDHDYGNNDAGVEWEHKDASAKIFHGFFQTPLDSPRRQRNGVYDARIFGPVGKRLQVILLDTRYFRSTLEKGNRSLPGFRALPYVPNLKPGATILGESQWKWLEERLREPAEVRVIGSSIQVVSDQHPFEKWDNFPLERARLYELIRKTSASGVVIVSGDRHLGDISLDPIAIGYPLFDVTASGLNQGTAAWRESEPNLRRVAGLAWGNHFGSIEIDWGKIVPEIKLQLRHEDGEIAVQTRVPLSVLKAAPAPILRPAGVLSAMEVLKVSEGETVRVQFAVRGARAISGQRWLLHSEVDFRNQRNLTVVVNPSARTEFPADRGIESFVEKTVRFTGTVSIYNGSKQVIVDAGTQIELISPVVDPSPAR